MTAIDVLRRFLLGALLGAIGVAFVNLEWAEFSLWETVASAILFGAWSVWRRSRELKRRARQVKPGAA